jgi:hypothetical protein
MLTIKSQPYNSVWISADSQEELGLTFMRFQEYYESANPKFRNNIFTLGQLRHWYSETYGANNYHLTWIGFNFPSKVLVPFKEGLFDPLTIEENRLLELLRYRKDNFYIIGAQNNSVLRHELSHAMYGYNPEYQKAIDSFIHKNKKGFSKVSKYILNKGYHHTVVNDEIQAYITDNDDEFIINNLNPVLISGINSIYKKFRSKGLHK